MSRVIARASQSRAAQGRRERSELCARPIGREGGSPERLVPTRPDAQAGGRLTLEQLLDSVWEGLRAGGTAECPVCDGPMQRTGPGGARCGRCGTTMD